MGYPPHIFGNTPKMVNSQHHLQLPEERLLLAGGCHDSCRGRLLNTQSTTKLRIHCKNEVSPSFTAMKSRQVIQIYKNGFCIFFSLHHRRWFLRPPCPPTPSLGLRSFPVDCHVFDDMGRSPCEIPIRNNVSRIYKVKQAMRIKIITSTIDLHIIALTITCNPTTKATNTTPEAILGHICRCQVAGCPMTNSTTNNLSQADTQQRYLVNLVGGWKILVNLGHLFSGRGENTKETRNNHLVT